MSSEIESQKKSGILILSPRGRLIGGAGSGLRLAILDHFEQGDHSIPVDLSAVDTIDSASIGEVVSAFASVTRRQRTLAMLGPGKTVLETLRLTRLDQLLPIHMSEREAFAALAADGRRSLSALHEFMED